MNSLTEFVSEVVLGKVNYFPEFDKKAQKQSQIQKHISIKIINEQFTPITADLFKMESKVTIPYKAGDLNEYYQEINPPPPKI